MDKKDLNENKEFRKVNNVKKFQDGVNTVVNIKTWQSVGLIAVVLAVIVMIVLMAFRQNAVMISKNNPNPSAAAQSNLPRRQTAFCQWKGTQTPLWQSAWEIRRQTFCTAPRPLRG